MALPPGPPSPALQGAIAVGFMGGFTTFSSFAYQTVTLARGDALLMALANIGLNVILCLAAAAAGITLMRSLTS